MKLGLDPLNEVEKTTLSLNSLAKRKEFPQSRVLCFFTIWAIAELILLLFINKSITL
jgi:hypothetical protein